jgi:uncharacterized phiE125 gp8 family phage protein
MMTASLIQITKPDVEPVELDEMKLHCRIEADIHEEDDLVLSLIRAAREKFEKLTGRQIMQSTWELVLDGMPSGVIQLPRPPLSSIVSIKYIDPYDYTEQTIDPSLYEVDIGPTPGEIRPAYLQQFWPMARCWPGSVRIRFIAGWAEEDVPDSIKAAIKLLVGHWFENRETVNEKPGDEIPLCWDSLIWLWKTWGTTCVLDA